jgi:hypothetical protein
VNVGEGQHDTRELSAARLAEFGVPPQVIAYALERNAGWFPYAYMTALFAVLGAGIAVGGGFLWPFLEALTHRNAIAHAQEAGALLYHANFGLSLVLALFGWIFVGGTLVTIPFVQTPRMRASMLVATALWSNGPFERWLFVRSLRRVTEADPERYLQRWANHNNKLTGVLGAAVFLVSALAVARDVGAHTLYTQDAYIRAPFFPWGSRAPHAWRDATEVELGCNHIGGRNAADNIIYDVTFADGASVDVALGIPLRGGDWLENAERIDAQLREGGASFRRWSWMQREPLHPACLAVMRQNFGADYPRIERLLRVGELPDR